MTELNKNIPQSHQIDLVKHIAKLWTKRKVIIKWGIIGALVGLVIGFSIPKTYKASVTLAPETKQKMGSGVSSIASMMGVNFDTSVDAISIEMFPDVVASTPFIYELFDVPVTFERRDSVINTSLLDYMKNYQKRAWWTYVIRAPFKVLGWVMSLASDEEPEQLDAELDMQNLPRDERRVISYFAENISVFMDKKTGKTSISLEMQDPLVVASVVEHIKDNLTAYMTKYRTSKVSQDVANLTEIMEMRRAEYYQAQQAYASFSDSNRNVVLLSALAEKDRLQQEMNLAYQVYSQVATQLEAARIKELEAKPVFAVLEPVKIPISKSAPSKAKLLIVFAFLAVCAAAVWVLFGEEYYHRVKENILNDKD